MAKTIGALRVEGDICLFLGYEFDACGELVARSWEVVFTKLTENIRIYGSPRRRPSLFVPSRR